MIPTSSKERSKLIDAHVGARVRMRRKFMALNQTELAQALGLTFQQVQKYERGSNRISASKLYEISQFLKVPVQYFFEGYDDTAGSHDFEKSHSEQAVHGFLSTAEGIEIAEAFPRIPNLKHRRKVMELVRTLSEDLSHPSGPSEQLVGINTKFG